ncbi:ATP-binding cassette domain-containing protein [Burkholderia guangdongensis]|uniref:ATP-binding cassette domain-containing protein n=1 Tax=Burkholderia guangdongensis TaxID=1792500 RepID=UPI0015C9DFFB|nr:ABC transporter ATP-binding protein [Burkholderia guangdongensis]
MTIRLAVIVLSVLLSSAAISLAPIFLASLIDHTKSPSAAHDLSLLVLFYIAARFAGQILVDLRWLIVNPFLYRLSYRLATLMAARIGTQSNYSVRIADHTESITRRVAIVSKMQTGSMGVAYSVLSGFLPAICDLIVVIAAVSTLAGDVFPHMLVTAIAILLLAVKFMRRRELDRTAVAHNADNDVFAQYGGLISNAKLIHEYDALPFFQQRLRSAIGTSMAAHNRLFLTKSVRGIAITLATAIAYLIVLLVAARRVADGQFGAGEIFLLATFLDRLVQPMSNLSNSVNGFQSGIVAMSSGYDELDSLDREYAPTNPSVLTFSAARRAPTDANEPIACRGDRVHVTGKSGSGKSTFLSRVYAAAQAEHDRHAVLFLQANPEIVDGTVRDNIRLADESISEAAALESLEIWPAHGGRRINLDESARSLSLGERQFIAIVRAALRKPNILIIDEALNSIDVTSEDAVLRYLQTSLPETILFLVSHRPLQSIKPDFSVDFGKTRGAAKLVFT